MTLKTIYLHGALADQFGASHAFHVENPAEAFRAMCAMVPGFRAALESLNVYVYREAEGRRVGQDLVDFKFPFTNGEIALSIHPEIAGSKDDGLGKLLLGVLVIGASFLVPASGLLWGSVTSSTVMQIGLGMALGGLSQMLMPQTGSDADEREQPKSQIASGAVNASSPGMGVPVVVGLCVVGSLVVSGAVHIEELEV